MKENLCCEVLAWTETREGTEAGGVEQRKRSEDLEADLETLALDPSHLLPGERLLSSLGLFSKINEATRALTACLALSIES